MKRQSKFNLVAVGLLSAGLLGMSYIAKVQAQGESGAGEGTLTPRMFVSYDTGSNSTTFLASPGVAPHGSTWADIIGTNSAGGSVVTTNPYTGTFFTNTTYTFSSTGIDFFVQIGYLGSNSFSATSTSIWMSVRNASKRL